MRTPLLLAFSAATVLAGAQSTSPRFIEVLVTDSIHLPFMGMDFEVSMPNPTEMVDTEQLGDDPSEKTIDRMLNEADAKAKATEGRLLSSMTAAGFKFRKSATGHAEDYSFGTGRTFEVNTYLVELGGGSDMERFNALMEPEPNVTLTPKDMHYGPASAEASRMMRKLYDQAQMKAQALVSVTGGKLGAMISAQEVTRDEGSFLEQLFKMDKMGGNDEETLRMMSATHNTTMAFRFALTD